MRSKHLESVVSVIILAVLFIIVVGVLIKQKPAETEDLAFLLPAGCADICESTLTTDMPYVSNIMRYLMYYNSYGEQDEACRLFAQIPKGARDRLLSLDYGLAEARCPQRLPIHELMAEAVSKLA